MFESMSNQQKLDVIANYRMSMPEDNKDCYLTHNGKSLFSHELHVIKQANQLAQLKKIISQSSLNTGTQLQLKIGVAVAIIISIIGLVIGLLK